MKKKGELLCVCVYEPVCVSAPPPSPPPRAPAPQEGGERKGISTGRRVRVCVCVCVSFCGTLGGDGGFLG
jgi:hypothetical protein